MEDFIKASEPLNKLTDKDVRIVYLPPATVVSSHYTGENPEEDAGNQLKAFIQNVNLPALQPGFRVYGFNNPSPSEENVPYGYEFLAVIPDALPVKEPLTKKYFPGGLYAAYCIKMGDFHLWQNLYEYVSSNDTYDIDWEREPQGMQGFLEEHLNAHTYYTEENQHFIQLDLLIPIKMKGRAHHGLERTT